MNGKIAKRLRAEAREVAAGYAAKSPYPIAIASLSKRLYKRIKRLYTRGAYA